MGKEITRKVIGSFILTAQYCFQFGEFIFKTHPNHLHYDIEFPGIAQHFLGAYMSWISCGVKVRLNFKIAIIDLPC